MVREKNNPGIFKILLNHLRFDVGIRGATVIIREPGLSQKENLSELQRDIGEVERMLKALIKSLKKPLNP